MFVQDKRHHQQNRESTVKASRSLFSDDAPSRLWSETESEMESEALMNVCQAFLFLNKHTHTTLTLNVSPQICKNDTVQVHFWYT